MVVKWWSNGGQHCSKSMGAEAVSQACSGTSVHAVQTLLCKALWSSSDTHTFDWRSARVDLASCTHCARWAAAASRAPRSSDDGGRAAVRMRVVMWACGIVHHAGAAHVIPQAPGNTKTQHEQMWGHQLKPRPRFQADNPEWPTCINFGRIPSQAPLTRTALHGMKHVHTQWVCGPENPTPSSITRQTIGNTNKTTQQRASPTRLARPARPARGLCTRSVSPPALPVWQAVPVA